MELDAFRNWTARLHAKLAADARVIGLVMLGSSAEVQRTPDAWSDHDFFVITHPGTQEALRTSLEWLPEPDQIVLRPRETEHGLKVMYADGHVIEFAVFDFQELNLARVNDYRVIFEPADGSISAVLRQLEAPVAPSSFDREREIEIMLMLLAIGSGRVARGEVISGGRFIKDFALSGLLRLLAHDHPPAVGGIPDNLDPFRRVEACYPAIAPRIHAALLLEPLAAAVALLDIAETTLQPMPASINVIRSEIRRAQGNNPMTPTTHARTLHESAIVIDGHSDILMAVADGRLDLATRFDLPTPDGWQPPVGSALSGLAEDLGFPLHAAYFGTMGHYDLPRWREGGVTVQTCAIYLEDHQLDRALQRGLEMTWALHQAAEKHADFRIIRTVSDIHAAKRDGKVGLLLSFEGFEALGQDLRFLDLYYQLGLRMASLTHMRRNLFGDGAHQGVRTGGLTPQGRAAIQRMNELGIVVDLAHISDEGFWEILEVAKAPLVLSHSTPTMFDDPRRAPASGGMNPYSALVLPRDRAKLEAIRDNGGVIGIISFGKASLEGVIADIDLAVEVAGEDHVGLGSDYYGLAFAPTGLEDISKLGRITDALVGRGYTDDVILKILGGNFLRVFEQVWKEI